MKTIKLLFIFLGCTLLLASCSKSDDEVSLPVDDYLIFGHFYGLCVGENCIEIFKIEGDFLYEDSNDTYPGSDDFYEADFTALPNNVFEEVNGIQDLFPDALLDEEEAVIGTPDVTDGGGLYIESYKDGVRDFWLLDLDTQNVPEAYHEFMDAVVEKITEINN